MTSVVTLNVGGTLYTTTEGTLLKHESFFSGLLSNNFSTTLDYNNNIFIDRSGELFKYVLEFLRTNALPKRALANKALLEELRQEAEFYCIEELIAEIDSKLDPTQNNDKKIRIFELEDYLKKGFHVIGRGVEPFRYHQCPHGHDPVRIGKDLYIDSQCRHSHVKLVEENVPFMIVSTSVPTGPIFDASAEIKCGEKRIVSEFR